MRVLWLLIMRGAAVELRMKIEIGVWRSFFDGVFFFSSALLAVFYGAALANVIRGVPLQIDGYFFLPLWTNWRTGPEPGILDWYTILVGITAYFALAQHGALWVAHKTEGEVSKRARRIVKIIWWVVASLTAIVTLVTFRVQPQVLANLANHPWGFIFPTLAVAGLVGVIISVSGALSPKRESCAFFASCAYLLGMLTSVVFGLYPYVLPARGGKALSLTIYNSGTTDHGMRIGITWWIVGIILAAGYFIFLYRRFAGKVGAGDGHGY